MKLETENASHYGAMTEADRARQLANANSGITWSKKEEKRLLLKLDLMIVPLVSGRPCVFSRLETDLKSIADVHIWPPVLR